MIKIPKDFPVRPLRTARQKAKAKDPVTCGTCGLTWDAAVYPGPSARCHFESYHEPEPEPLDAREAMQPIAAKQGWNVESQLELALGFINSRGQGDAFRRYLRAHAREENRVDY